MAPKVNKNLLPLKIHYFFKYGGIAFFTLLPVMARQKGIPELAVGLLWTVTPLASCVINILTSTLADAFKIHRAMFLAGEVALSISFILVFLLPDISNFSAPQMEATLSLQCYDESISRLAVCPNAPISDNVLKLPIFQECTDNNTLRKVSETKKTNRDCMLNCNFPHNENSIFLNLNETLYLPNNLNLSYSNEQSLYSVCDDNCIFITEVNTTESLSQSYNITCGRKYDALCVYDCGSYGSRAKGSKTLTDVVRTLEFWLIFILLILIYGGNATTTTMADTVCFYILGQNRHKYGHQRMWGSLGWGIFGTISGALVDVYSQGKAQTNYTPALIVASMLLTINMLASLWIKFTKADKEKLKARAVGKAMCSLKITVYLVTVVVIGMSMGVVWTFLFIVVEDVAIAWNPDFAHLKLLQGLMVGAACFLGEVPFLFLSSYIIKRLGNIPTFALSMAMFSLRIFLYSFVTNPWFFLPIDMLHGVSFGVFYPNMISYGSAVAPKGAKATVQGIVKSLFIVGVSLGGMVGGLLIDTVGGSMMYFYLGLFDAAFTLCFIIVQFLIKRMNSRDSQDHEGYTAAGEGHDIQNGFGPVLNDCDAEEHGICDQLALPYPDSVDLPQGERTSDSK